VRFNAILNAPVFGSIIPEWLLRLEICTHRLSRYSNERDFRQGEDAQTKINPDKLRAFAFTECVSFVMRSVPLKKFYATVNIRGRIAGKDSY
jgi:hypothetical protein